MLGDVLEYDLLCEENVLWRDIEKLVSGGILSIITIYVLELQDKARTLTIEIVKDKNLPMSRVASGNPVLPKTHSVEH